MQTQKTDNTLPPVPPVLSVQGGREEGQKDQRMRYGIMDILMTMALVVLVAATAGPRFSKAAAENRLAEMVDILHAVRSNIECHRLANGGLLPGQKAPGADVSADAFLRTMTARRESGYVRLNGFPANPFVSGDAAAAVTCVNSIDALPTGDEGTGWWFNSATGQFRACDSRFHSVY